MAAEETPQGGSRVELCRSVGGAHFWRIRVEVGASALEIADATELAVRADAGLAELYSDDPDGG